MENQAGYSLEFRIVNGLPADQLDKPHKWVPAEQCAFVNPPVAPRWRLKGLPLTKIAMVCRWPTEIDGLPTKNGGFFHGYVK